MPSRWRSQDGTPKAPHDPPKSRGSLRADGLATTATSDLVGRHTETSANGRVAIIVHDSIYDAVNQPVTEFTWDLAAAGWSTVVCRYASGGAESVRSYLASLYNSTDGLKGAILIGDIPYIVFELMQSWDGGTSWEYEDFPCDIYYMDLDGGWSDTLSDRQVSAGNGKYDTRSGDPALEIWVGRIRTGNLATLGSEADLVTSYLARDRGFRATPGYTSLYGLTYDDDDWGYMAEDDRIAMETVFGTGSCASVGEAEQTTAADYKTNRLPQSTRWRLVRSHGSPYSHGFYRNSRAAFEYVTTSDYRSIDPPGAFNSLFICSACDYTVANYLAGTVAFNPGSAAVFALGSSKTGGMWNDGYFFGPMSVGNCIGESFRQWFNQNQAFYPSLAPEWWYGMILLGDPSLHPNPSAYPAYYRLALSAFPAAGGTLTPSAGDHPYPAGQMIPVSAVATPGYRFDRWTGPVVDPLSESTSISLSADAAVTACFTPISIAEVKQQPDGSAVALAEKAVTCVGTDWFYVEDDSRTCGIKVQRAGHGLAVGSRANVRGTLGTDTNKERCISASQTANAGTHSLKPVYLNVRALGGSNWHYNTSTGAGQAGVTGEGGLNNLGLLARVTGFVEPIDSTSFYVKNCRDSVRVILPAGLSVPSGNTLVAVTGVVTTTNSSGVMLPALRVRLQSDILPL